VIGSVGLRPPHHTSLIGATIGNYRVVAKLGEGGMGEVYRAEHPLIGKKVAIKVLREDSPDAAERFFNEARLVNEIGHPNIVDIVDYGVVEKPTGRFVYLIMELLAGEPLAGVLAREGRLLAPRAAGIALQIADALGACHRKGVIHRDLKPDNVVLLRGDFVKVLDFGIAKLASARPHTDRGMVVGTPAYMAPEQCEGRRDVDARADVYALGILLYQMLSGAVPFSGDTYGDVLNQHLTRRPEKLSGALGAVVQRALEKRREDRFESMEAFAKGLQAPGYRLQVPEMALPLPAPISVVTQQPTTLTQSAAEIQTRPARLGVIVTSALCALVLLGAGALWLRRTDTATATVRATDAATVTVAAPAPPPPPLPVVTPAPPETVRLSLATDPPGADVLLDGVVRGKTPLVLEVPRGDGELAVTFRLAGYKEKTRAVRARGDAALDVALERLAPAKPAPRPAKPAKPLDDDAVLPPNF